MYNNLLDINGLNTTGQFSPKLVEGQALVRSIFYAQIYVPLNIQVPKRAEYFNIFLFEDGHGSVQVDGEIYPVQKRKVIVVFPGQLCSVNLLAGTVVHYLMAKKEIYEAVTSITRLRVSKSKPISAFNIEEEAFRILLHEFKEVGRLLEQYEETEDIIVSRFKTTYLILKASCMKLRDFELNEAIHPVLSRFMNLLEHSYKEHSSVMYYAKELSISSNYLNMLCTSLMHISAKQLIQNRRLQEAKQLLLGTGLSVKEVAYNLGFNDLSHFSSFFKKETGFAPKDFLQLRLKGFKY